MHDAGESLQERDRAGGAHPHVVACRALATLVLALLLVPRLPFDAPVRWQAVVEAQDVPPAFLGLITAGPDGNMWFVETVERRIGRITPAGHVSAFAVPPVAGTPFALTRGHDGNLWFTAKHSIGRMTLDGHVTVFPLPVHVQPGASIITGPDGNLWFTTAAGDGIVRMTPKGHTRVFDVPEADNLASGPDGNLWFTQTRADAIGRLSLLGRVTEFMLPQHKAHDDASGLGAPIAIVAGTDGNLWFTEFAQRLGRISPQGHITEFTLPDRPCCVPYYLTPGLDGNLWFTELYGNGVDRVTPRGRSVHFGLPARSSGPFGIAAGADGNIWVTETCSNRVVRLTPQGLLRVDFLD